MAQQNNTISPDPEMNAGSSGGDAVADANRGKLAALSGSGLQISQMGTWLGIGLVAAVTGYFVYPLLHWTSPNTALPQKPAAATLVSATNVMPANPNTGALLTPNGPNQTQPMLGNNGMPVNAYPNAGAQPQSSNGPKAPNPALAQADAGRRAPVMAFSGGSYGLGSASAGRSQMEQPVGPANAASSPSQNSGFIQTPSGASYSASDRGNELDRARQHKAIEMARATLISNRSYLLSAGTLIPCILQTAINSTQAGYVSCIIPHDVWSEDGRIVLIEKGSKVLGQYSGGIQQGQYRMFILWTRALTPRGVAIDLGSPAADDLGRAGVSGGVDSQFWSRFGAALMLSVIEDLGNVASAHFAGTGTNTTQVPSSTANTALSSTINIKPVLKKNQGDDVAIFVAKDFDFRNVYSVALRH